MPVAPRPRGVVAKAGLSPSRAREPIAAGSEHARARDRTRGQGYTLGLALI